MTNEEIAAKLSDVEARGKSNTHRIDEVEKKQCDLDKLVTAVAVMATKQEAIETDVTEIKADVKTLTGKPGKRFEVLMDKAAWLVIATAIGYLLAQLGIK